MKPYYELLREVRDSLTQDNWDKTCYYFSYKNNKLYMSVHGAAQRLVNPEVAKALGNNNIIATMPGIIVADDAFDDIIDVTIINCYHNYLLVWKERPTWIKEDYISNNKNYENVNLHYLMGMFGLTYGFEIQESTTLDMIQEKLSEAAIWAEENEYFLE